VISALLDSEGDVLAYERRTGATLIVALNLGASAQRLELPIWASCYRLLLSTRGEAPLSKTTCCCCGRMRA
jgi:alpha-glucosidase